MCKDMLVISPFAGYENAGQAGTKTHYNYIKKLQDCYNLTIITHIRPGEEKLVLNNGIKAKIVVDGKPNFKERIFTRILTNNIFSRYCFIGYAFESLFMKEAKKLYKSGYRPYCIIFDWTQCAFLIKKVKKIFPEALTVCAEQDVSYLSLYRKYVSNKVLLKKVIDYFKYNTVKGKEIYFLNFADDIVTFNNKDKKLLESEKNFKKEVRVISPYYDNYSKLERKPSGKQIIFYGAMGRYENYASAIWFIKNVMPELPKDVIFTVIGSNPDKSLLQYASTNVKITGFVEDVSHYFQNSLCLVAPLVLGAGIKVKVLEAFSAGIPVLTNEIGIEGIPAQDGKDFIYCETPQDYIESIKHLINDSNFASDIGKSGRKFVLNNFDYNKDSYVHF
ncbi:MAG: glycosyltransferase family 4 protein [Treponema sp.]|nr:glycosyltransferase family 4 protein [Treponema sp.]